MELKSSHPVESAEYIQFQQLQDKLAFKYWFHLF